MNINTSHNLRWQAPQALWAGLPAADLARPAILRFGADDFMDQVLATLARDPAAIAGLVARPETWRAPMGSTADLIERVPLPRVAQRSLRAVASRQPRQAVTVASSAPLKLYQPAHQRYYLAGASLVCGVPGFPDRTLVPGDAEQVHAVLRRLLPDATGALHEHAYLKDAQGTRWQRVAAAGDDGQPVAGEDTLPVFPLRHQDDTGHARMLWTALVPVGRREEYLGATVTATPLPAYAQGQRDAIAGVSSGTPGATAQPSTRVRMTQFQMDVAEPWKTLVRAAYKAAATHSGNPSIGGDNESPADAAGRIFEVNLQLQQQSWLVLLDMAQHLADEMPALWTAITSGSAAGLTDPQQRLFERLGQAVMSPALQTALHRPLTGTEVRPPLPHLRAALAAIAMPGVGARLEASTATYTGNSLGLADWPGFHFLLAGIDSNGQPAGAYAAFGTPLADDQLPADLGPDPLAGPVPGQAQAQWLDRLTALFARALPLQVEAGALPYALQARDAIAALAASPAAADMADGGWFVIRHVHLRRDCGPLHPPLVSAPSQRFKLASFFDPDAPARPIRISLPLDTTPAGLRKFNRNTAFVMSDLLCGQVQRAKGLGLVDLVRSVLPWPLHKDLDVGAGGPCQNGNGVNIGMICSLSIPIITICALILLMIIVTLLDLIFRWLPYFVMCFPLPGLKGKK